MEDSTPESVDLECGIATCSLSRRQMERDLIMSFDSRDLGRHEAWFLIETKWLDAWMRYVMGDDEMTALRPGPVKNDTLFDRIEFHVRDNLLATKDYRGVNPQVYALYSELYGTDNATPIARWILDLYASPVMIDDISEMLRVPRLKARSVVAEMNEELQRYEQKNLQGLQTRIVASESWLRRCCCRCEFLVPCLNRLLGGGPTYKSEKDSTWFYCWKRKREKQKRMTESEETSICDDFSDDETQGLLG